MNGKRDTAPHDAPLERLQRWMQAVIVHPAGVARGLDSDEARAEIDCGADDVERIVLRSRALDAVRRLEVYGNAYFARLHECLRDEFPATATLVGEEAFAGFVHEYLRERPSRSWTLADLGAGFPDFLDASRARSAETGRGDDPAAAHWSDLVVDLARLERTYSEVFDGPGIETRPPDAAPDLLAIPPEAWSHLQLECAPCLRLLACRHPVHEYASAVRQGQAEPVPPDPCPTWLVVTRRDWVVRRESVPRSAFVLLSALQSGEPLGAALESAVAVEPDDLEVWAARLGEWFRHWTGSRWILGAARAS
jgi:hypothetical protein